MAMSKATRLFVFQLAFGALLGGLQAFELALNTNWWMSTKQAIALCIFSITFGVFVSGILGILTLWPLYKQRKITTGIHLWTLASVVHLVLLFTPFVTRLIGQGQQTLGTMMMTVCGLFSFLIWSNAQYWFRKVESGETSTRMVLVLFLGGTLISTGIGFSLFRSQSLGTEHSINTDPDIIVVTFDGLGANAVSSLSNSSLALTPNIDALASQCIQYTDAISVASNVLPAQTAILSGHYPGQLGVLDNEGLVRFSVETMSERFAREGYATAIFADNPVLTLDSGFAQGFQLVDVSTTTKLLGSSLKGAGELQVFKLLEPWLDLQQSLSSLSQTASFLQDYSRLPVFSWTQMEIPEGLAEREYRQVVEELDQEFGDFVRLLRNRGVERDTMLILTSGFGTHFDFGKGSHMGVSDSVIKVPLVVCPLKGEGVQGGFVVASQVRTIDLPNTIYAQVGFSHNKNIQSIDISDLGKEANVYQTLLMGEDPTVEGGYELGYRFQATNSERMYKYIWKTHRKLHGIYDLSKDPEERNNIVDSAETMSSELSTALTQATRSIPELMMSDNLLMIDAFLPIP